MESIRRFVSKHSIIRTLRTSPSSRQPFFGQAASFHQGRSMLSASSNRKPALDISRRQFLKLAAALPAIPYPATQTSPSVDPWSETSAILARIHEPVFPQRDFILRNYNGDINAAITACNAAGGGRVVVPAGTFPTGPIRLKSRVNLHLSEGAVLKFSTNPKDYLPVVFTRFEGTELMNYSPFIYAFEQEDIAITGPGIVDGQA